MSLTLQSGFTWPSVAFSATLASLPAVSFASFANLSSTMTALFRQPPISVHLIPGPSEAARSTGVISANFSIAALFSCTESLGQRTTHITVTATVTVTPVATIKAQNLVVPVTEAFPETRSIQVTYITTKTPAPDTTGIVFKLYRPESENYGASSDGSNGTKTQMIVGGILGPICLGVVMLMLIAMWRGRGQTHGRHSKVEDGKYHRREHRSKNDMINEAHRRRRERNRRGRERDIELNAVTQLM
jgi:hypothetical protein